MFFFHLCVYIAHCPLLEDRLKQSRHPNKSSYSVNDTVTFYCEKDYGINGTKQITCLPDSTWSHEQPECLSTYV